MPEENTLITGATTHHYNIILSMNVYSMVLLGNNHTLATLLTPHLPYRPLFSSHLQRDLAQTPSPLLYLAVTALCAMPSRALGPSLWAPDTPLSSSSPCYHNLVPLLISPSQYFNNNFTHELSPCRSGQQILLGDRVIVKGERPGESNHDSLSLNVVPL